MGHRDGEHPNLIRSSFHVALSELTGASVVGSSGRSHVRAKATATHPASRQKVNGGYHATVAAYTVLKTRGPHTAMDVCSGGKAAEKQHTMRSGATHQC